MPIRPSQRYFYPIDWRELSHAIRFGRAGGACERCGRRHGAEVVTLSGTWNGRRGLWWDEAVAAWRCARGRVIPRSLAQRLPVPERMRNGAGCITTDQRRGRGLQLALWPGLEVALLDGAPLVLRTLRVSLACCHLNHDPTDNRPLNLAALCQTCHLDHDRADNLRRRMARMGTGEGLAL